MGAPVLQFKRGNLADLPGLRAGEPGFTSDNFNLYVGLDSSTNNNKFFGSHRYWTQETTTAGSAVRVVEGTNNGSNYIELKSPASLAGNLTYTLPGTDAANGILVSDGSGNLTFTTTVTGSGGGLTAGTTPLTTLDIDGGTDIGADLADGDLLVVDDGAGGTNRKTAMSRVKSYVLGGGAGATFGNINVTGIGTVAFVDSTQLKVSGVSTFTGAVDANGNLDVAGTATFATPLANSNLANDSVSFGGVSVDLGASDATPAFNLSDATSYPTSSLVGTITNAQLAGSIANGKLANSTVSLGGVSIALGASDATPAFDLQDATNLPTTSLTGTVTNAQLAGSIANSKLSNDSVSFGGVSVDLGASDATPAFDLSDATAYPTSSLVGTITNAQLAGSIANSKLASPSASIGGVTITLGGTDATPAFDLSDATAYPTGSLSGTITNGQLAGSIADGKLNTITTANKVGIAALDIDGGTDIGADLADADLLVVDDGAGGTNRKTAMSRVKSYVLGGGSGATFAAINVTGIASVAYTDATQLKVSGISTFTGQTNHSTINASSTVTGTAFHTGAEGSAIRVTSNTISGPATITLDPAGVGDNTGKVVIAGDLQIDGTTTTVNSTTMTVDDKNLVLGSGAANDAAADGGGITIESGSGNKTFQFQDTGDNLGSSENLNVASGKAYKVNNVSVLNATTLGSSVVASSLTSVGNLTTLDVTGATNLNATTQSTSNTTGALIVDGGVGIAKNAHIGGTLDVDGQLTSAAPLRNSTGAGLIPGVGVITATSDAGLVTAFKFRGNGLENFIVEDGIADVVLSGVAATTFTTSETTTATEGQTAVSVSAGYVDGFMDVYLNGIRLITGTDYTETNSTTITLASGATAGDEIETVAWKSLGDVVNIASLKTAGNLTVTGVTTATGGVIGNLTGNVTGNTSGSSGSCTGNAATATALANARTIGGVSFDGSANINLPGVNASGNQDTSGNAATATKLAATKTIAGVAFDGSANISLNNNAITNGAGYITATLTDEEVQDKVGAMFSSNTETGITATYQDADGTIDLVVGTLNQDTTGNAATATALETARTIGGVSFDGSANINLPGVNASGNQDTSGNAATATVGTTITVADESSDTTCFPLFATGATGNLGAKSGSNLTFNSDTGALGATSFVGSGSGLTAGTTPISTLDIDGGTATSTLANADLFIVDDGAGGTNRKVTFQTISDAVLGGSGGATFAAVNVTGIGTFGGVLDSNGGANISGGAGLVASSAKVSDLTSGRVVLAGTSGEIEDSGNLTFSGSALTVTGTANVTSNLTVGGNLTVNGTTTQVNTVNTTIEDTLLELQKVDGGNLGSDTNKDVGIVMNYYDGSAKKAAMFWDDSAGRFAFGSVVTENTGVLGSVTYGGVEMGSLYLNDCAGASQVISCSGTTRSLENITIDGGSF